MPDTQPKRYEMPADDDRTILRNSLLKTLAAVPNYFSSPITIVDLDATDLFSFNTALGSAIEVATVDVLNNLRNTWDPDGTWYEYSFVRYPESFPDVRLVRGPNDTQPIIGIELKGWYLLSKEGEPSFRYEASANACTVWDLLVCYPWALSGVLSGSPKLFEPYIEQAKYAADMRTYYWHNRQGDSSNRNENITFAETQPYPAARSQYTDIPEQDGGDNFGRLARGVGPMKEWTEESLETRLCGIEAKYWIEFFSAFKVSNTPEKTADEVNKLVRKVVRAKRGVKVGNNEALKQYLTSFIDLQRTWPLAVDYLERSR